ncbi:MAG TPA: hypothetical protein VJ933_04545, partial [Phaeodactylibacter sp.]|nr:hypothetical protein [Phaeodactylibacter sp.]
MGSPEFSEEGRCIVPATDGGFYIGGSRNGESLIIKIDDNENVVWERVFSFSGATGPEEKVFHLLEDGPFLVGTTWLGQTSQDHYLFKYNYDTDNFVWLRRISNSSYNRTFDIINLPGTPHYTLIGDRHENDTYGCDMTYLEIDKNAGTLLTSRRFSLGSCEVGVDAVLYDNQIFITGRYNAFGGGSNGMRPAITSLTLNGMENWTRLHLINTNTDARLYSREIIEDDGFLVVCGMGDIDGTSTIDQESFIYKTDSNGEMIWATIIDVPEGNREVLKSVVEQEDGYLAFGQFTPVNGGPRKMLLVKVDKAGNLSWSKTLEDNLDFLAPQKNGATHSNGFSYLLATQNDGSDSDIALLKISNTGELASDCVELRNLNVEAWQLPNPFDGLFDLTIQNYNPENAAGQSATSAVDLPIDTVCHTPCGEICANGEDDDNDGLIDCDDDDCPCFVDCGNTFVKALGKPQNDESLATILQSSDGFLYAGGSSEDAGLILKLSTEGEILSQLTFDFTPRQDRILSMIEDSEGYIVGAGFGQSMSSNERIGFIFKYDPVSESIIWSNSFSERAGFWTVNINPANGNYLAAGAWTVAGQNAVIAEFDRNNGSLNWTNEIDVGLSEAYYGIVPVGNILYLPNRFTMFTFADEMKAGITALDG